MSYSFKAPYSNIGSRKSCFHLWFVSIVQVNFRRTPYMYLSPIRKIRIGKFSIFSVLLNFAQKHVMDINLRRWFAKLNEKFGKIAIYFSSQSLFNSIQLTLCCFYFFKSSEKYTFWRSARLASVAAKIFSFNSDFCTMSNFFKFRNNSEPYGAKY